jgi:hypothetical protein
MIISTLDENKSLATYNGTPPVTFLSRAPFFRRQCVEARQVVVTSCHTTVISAFPFVPVVECVRLFIGWVESVILLYEASQPHPLHNCLPFFKNCCCLLTLPVHITSQSNAAILESVHTTFREKVMFADKYLY